MTGALIFAQNNASIDYTKLAVFAAARVTKYLNIPVSIVTDNKQWLLQNYPDHNFDNVIEIQPEKSSQQKRFYDGSLSAKTLEWKNLSRHQVYELTPYTNTLVIDSDYIISSSILKNAFEREYDIQIYKNSFDLAGWRNSVEFDRINQYSIPFYWATVFFFRKTPITKTFFDLITYIKENWLYFRMLYNIDSTLYRNDFAFSIAIHIMNGKTNGNFVVELPGTMTYCTDRDILIKLNDGKMQFLLEKKDRLGEYIAAKTTGIDVHVMNKVSLSRIIDGGGVSG
jgi:hypothetical protein